MNAFELGKVMGLVMCLILVCLGEDGRLKGKV